MMLSAIIGFEVKSTARRAITNGIHSVEDLDRQGNMQ